jgi:hypothetical protein
MLWDLFKELFNFSNGYVILGWVIVAYIMIKIFEKD